VQVIKVKPSKVMMYHFFGQPKQYQFCSLVFTLCIE